MMMMMKKKKQGTTGIFALIYIPESVYFLRMSTVTIIQPDREKQYCQGKQVIVLIQQKQTPGEN